MSKFISLLGCGVVGSVVGIGVAYGVASLPCSLLSKPADKVCYVRVFSKSLDVWKIGFLGGMAVGLISTKVSHSSHSNRIKFQPIHLSIVGVLILVGAVVANNKSFGFGVIPQSRVSSNIDALSSSWFDSLLMPDGRVSLARTPLLSTLLRPAREWFRYRQPLIAESGNSSTLTSPRMNAFLATIRWAETGTSDKQSYTKLVFNGTFNNFATHPRIKQCAPINGRKVCSTAAGAYQMLDKSWDDLQSNLGLKDFSPSSQDRMAIEYIRRNKAIRDVEAGNLEIAACKVGRVWASLICNSYDQNAKTLYELQAYYNKQLFVYKAY